MAATRITVTLPPEIVEEIDQIEPNRSRLVLEAIRRELARRRREALRQSMRSPHPETEVVAETGVDEWARRLPRESGADLLDPSKGTPVRWTPGKGWSEREK